MGVALGVGVGLLCLLVGFAMFLDGLETARIAAR